MKILNENQESLDYSFVDMTLFSITVTEVSIRIRIEQILTNQI
jgi:hypothetical protein